ncbi:hypothetical protein ACQBAR_17555 [Propionibacteriaceae bacterium Y1685]|uniref:hypothetical protein n=1 Tax=Microlunatus sp. Y1700 TaxID=3418487 RepID=UPI003B7E37D3
MTEPTDADRGTSARARDAAQRAELAAAHRRGESVRAQAMIDEFLTTMRTEGRPAEPLRATLLSGGEVRTDKSGWYLKKNRSVAIGDDGSYYVLTVPGGVLERIRGAKLRPTPPPLIVSQGGRDGEAGDLAFFLEATLERYRR